MRKIYFIVFFAFLFGTFITKVSCECVEKNNILQSLTITTNNLRLNDVAQQQMTGGESLISNHQLNDVPRSRVTDEEMIRDEIAGDKIEDAVQNCFEDYIKKIVEIPYTDDHDTLLRTIVQILTFEPTEMDKLYKTYEMFCETHKVTSDKLYDGASTRDIAKAYTSYNISNQQNKNAKLSDAAMRVIYHCAFNMQVNETLCDMFEQHNITLGEEGIIPIILSIFILKDRYLCKSESELIERVKKGKNQDEANALQAFYLTREIEMFKATFGCIPL